MTYINQPNSKSLNPLDLNPYWMLSIKDSFVNSSGDVYIIPDVTNGSRGLKNFSNHPYPTMTVYNTYSGVLFDSNTGSAMRTNSVSPNIPIYGTNKKSELWIVDKLNTNHSTNYIMHHTYTMTSYVWSNGTRFRYFVNDNTHRADWIVTNKGYGITITRMVFERDDDDYLTYRNYLNGILNHSNTSTLPLRNPTTSAQFQIGISGNIPGPTTFNGILFEWLFFDKHLTDLEAKKLTNFFKIKYNI